MPATAAQVFGPSTVDPGFNSTGEKTLLNMSTTLPAGGKNVIIVVFGKNVALYTNVRGTYRIYKGATLLYESTIGTITEFFSYGGMRAKHVLLVAVDNAPSGNDSYSFRINITAAGTTTDSVHVQGIVIKTDDASWAYNTTAVSIAAGATATVTSMTTAFPANSKVALVAVAYGSWTDLGNQLIGAGNIKLKAGTAVIASNEFNIGSYRAIEPIWVSLTYLHTPSSGSQTYSVEVTNGSTSTFNFYAEIVAFTVYGGAFLDTASVTLSNGVQVTVGNLTTSLSGDVVVIGLAAAENTGTTDVTAFNANDVVLQLNNSATGQISNLVGWFIEQTSYHGRSGVLPLFRIDTNVTNPSYQIKMTARVSGINGEAKILAFTIVAVVTVSVDDGGTGVDSVSVSASLSVLDTGAGVDATSLTSSIGDVGSGVDEVVMLLREVLDAGVGTELVDMVKGILDDGVGTDTINSPQFKQLFETGLGVDTPMITVPQFDAGIGVDLGETQLSIYGLVTLDNNVIVGVHSIPYRDLARDGLPIQTQRRFVDDKVYVGGVEVGVVTVEWEDKVADIVPGVRTVRVAGVVRLVE